MDMLKVGRDIMRPPRALAVGLVSNKDGAYRFYLHKHIVLLLDTRTGRLRNTGNDGFFAPMQNQYELLACLKVHFPF